MLSIGGIGVDASGTSCGGSVISSAILLVAIGTIQEYSGDKGVDLTKFKTIHFGELLARLGVKLPLPHATCLSIIRDA